MDSDQLTAGVIGHAMRVHSTLGPGLYERVYELALRHELLKAGYIVQQQLPLPVLYDGILLAEEGYRIDMLVNGILLLELKAVAALSEIHHAQILTYLRLSGIEKGLLINFNSVHLKDGIRRFVMTKARR